jgi:CrcB protein
MLKLLLIAAGSAVGGVARYALSGVVQRLTNGSFPTGTLLVNVVGCFLVGLLAAAFTGPYLIREEHRIALLVGVLGGFTTFSAFGLETFLLAADGEFWLAGANVILSTVGGFVAVWFGYRLAEHWFGV